MKLKLKPVLPHLVALLAFIILGYAYFPALFEGKVLNQSDIVMQQGGAQEIIQYRHATGQEPLWTNAMFSGMPANMISTIYEGNYLKYAYDLLFIGERPASYMIVAMISFYLLLLAFGVNPWLAMAGAVGFAFGSYNLQIMQAGHNTKMVAIAFMPMVLAGAAVAFRRRILWGAVLFGIALSFEIWAQHPQIAYYLGFVMAGYVIAEFFIALKAKTLRRFTKALACITAAGLLGVAANVNYLWPNWEYAKHTMRGGSELTLNREDERAATGLEYDYATAWSYGIGETINLMIPDFKGGASSGSLDESSESYRILRDARIENPRQALQSLPAYWGNQPFTAGPMYMGAVMVFLFVLGLILIKGPLKWWLAGVSLLALMLGWGSNVGGISRLFHDYLPMYNKFRTVSMAFVILQITIPLLGIFVLSCIFRRKIPKEKIIRGLKIALGVTAGFCLLAILIPSIAGSFMSPNDARLPDWLQNALIADRKAMLRADAFRSLIFILLAGGVVWLAVAEKLKTGYAVALVGVLVIFDLWPVDKRYLNNSHFVTQRQYKNVFAERPVDRLINQDTSYYRVLDYTVDTFNESLVSYYHKNIGGYSAAKLQRYQDMIDYHIVPEMQAFIDVAKTGFSMERIDSVLATQTALNMLNTKYLVVNPDAAPLENPYALGNAWFVTRYRIVDNANEEILGVGTIDPATEIVVNRQFAPIIGDRTFAYDSTAHIELTGYAPNLLRYRFSASTDQLAVFSEIYYPKGWKAFIDGVEVPIFRVNYLLRGLILPAGSYEVVFKYHPESYYKGGMISRIASSVLLAALLGLLIAEGVKRFRRKTD